MLVAMGLLVRPACVVLLIYAAVGLYNLNWDFQVGVPQEQIILALNELGIIGGLLLLSSRMRRTLPSGTRHDTCAAASSA